MQLRRAPLAAALDTVMARKRVPCAEKLEQIEAMQSALGGRTGPLSGAPLEDVDVDQIFMIEKRDKTYLPADRTWFKPHDW